nr:helix-turn-helix domain-containing protein [Clostridia bacterium]
MYCLKRVITLDEICPYVRFANIISLNENIADLINNDIKTRDCRLFYIIGGEGTLEVEGTSHALASGSLCIIQPGTMYRWCPQPGQSNDIICVNFDYTQDYSSRRKSYHPEIAETFDESHSHGQLFFDDAQCLNRPLWLDNIHAAEYPLRNLISEKLLSLPLSAVMMSHMLAQVILTAVRFSEEKNLSERSLDSIRVHSVLSYIQSNYQSDITNEKIAAHFNFHPNYLSRLIKQTTGQSLHRYVVLCRINAAKELLATSPMKVNEIAQTVGFTDIPHFTRAFRQHTGLLPSEYAALSDSERAGLELPSPDDRISYVSDTDTGCGCGI